MAGRGLPKEAAEVVVAFLIQTQVHKGGEAVGIRCRGRGLRGARPGFGQGGGQEVTGGRPLSWAGVAGELVEQEADAGVGPRLGMFPCRWPVCQLPVCRVRNVQGGHGLLVHESRSCCCFFLPDCTAAFSLLLLE